jgi:hypothetical protein
MDALEQKWVVAQLPRLASMRGNRGAQRATLSGSVGPNAQTEPPPKEGKGPVTSIMDTLREREAESWFAGGIDDDEHDGWSQIRLRSSSSLRWPQYERA